MTHTFAEIACSIFVLVPIAIEFGANKKLALEYSILASGTQPVNLTHLYFNLLRISSLGLYFPTILSVNFFFIFVDVVQSHS